MGLLDEAIREHLELKRRRGADVTEVTRQEREAFGPTGREAEALQEASPEAGHDLHPALDEPASFAADAPPDEPTRLHVAEVPVESPEPAAPPPADLHHRHDHELETEPPRPHGDPADRFPHAAPVPAAEPEPEAAHPTPDPDAPETPPEEPAASAQPTREFDLDEVRAAAGAEPEIVPADEEPEGEDVLEETPEFLQETPEHDRLWFEQRPPRDFDF